MRPLNFCKNAILVAMLSQYSDASANQVSIETNLSSSLLSVIDDIQRVLNPSFNFTITKTVQSSIEDNVENNIEEDVEEDIEEDVEEDIEEDVEEDIEEDVEEDIEADVEEDIEEDVEDDIEEDVEEDIEEDVEEDIEEDVEEDIEEDVEEDIEEDVEEDIEEDVEEDIEEDVEDDLEEDIEEDVEDDLEEDIEEDAEDDLEEDIEEDAEDDLEEDIEEDAEDDIEDDVNDDAENDIDHDAETDIANNLFSNAEEQALMQVLTAEEAIDDVIRLSIDTEIEKIFTDDWLILTNQEDVPEIISSGYTVLSEYPLNSIKKILVRVAAPYSYNFTRDGKASLYALNTSSRIVDLNNIYTLSSENEHKNTTPKSPRALLNISNSNAQSRIGMIDTVINNDHPALVSSKITTKYFGEINTQNSAFHGTAVAALLVGKDQQFQGLLDNTTLYAAEVFFDHSTEGQISTVASLVKALDYLVSNDVRVINLSLAGPPNNILQQTIYEYCKKGIVFVAAVGNLGPNAPAMYPAAYDCVIGVTAINQEQRIYRRAIRGSHVDVASYGVDVWSADGINGYVTQTGTSFAAPFVSAYLLSTIPDDPSAQSIWLKKVFDNLKDLGEPGRDDIYGNGALVVGSPKSAPTTSVKAAFE